MKEITYGKGAKDYSHTNFTAKAPYVRLSERI